MIKKFLVLISVLSVIMISGNVISAEEIEISHEEKVVTGLNIINAEKVTQESFIYSLASFLYENPQNVGTAEEIALATGMIDSKDEYRGRKSITVNDALKYALITLGYKEKCVAEGDYLKTAAELKLTENVKSGGSSRLKYPDAVEILYNVSEAQPMEAYYKTSADMGYRVLSDTNLLEQNRDIYKIHGLMTANTYTSIYSEDGTGNAKYIMIEDEEYIIPENLTADFLGQNVTAYVKQKKNSEPEIVYICERENKNEVVVIDAEDVEYVAEDFSYLEYIKEDSDKAEKVRFPSALRVIYNGVYCGDYTISDLMPDIGELKFIDNNSDGKFEIVFIKSYETLIVESVNKTDKKIINKYRFQDCIPALELEPDVSEVYYKIYDAEGNETDFDSITINNVLSIARSKNPDEQVVEIFIGGNEPLSGTITGINAVDNEISINDVTYRMAEDYLKYISFNNQTNELGMDYTFYLDYFNNIVYRKAVVKNDYCFVLKTYEDDEKYYIVYMDMDNDWYTSEFSKTVNLDDEKYSAVKAYTVLGEFQPQIMKLKFNSLDEVKSIDMAETVESYDENRFTKTPVATYAYRTDPRSFNMELYLDDGANLLVCEVDGSRRKEDYYFRDAAGYMRTDKSYPIVAYDVDRFGFSRMFSIVETPAISAYSTSSSMFVVTSVEQMCTTDDEVLPCLVGNIGDFMDLTIIGVNSTIFDGIAEGDVLNLRLNSSGRADYVTKIFSMGDFKPVSASNLYNNVVNIAGTVVDLDLEAGKIKINCGDKMASLRLNTTKAAHFYDPDRNTCEGKTAADIKIGDKILCSLSYGNISQIVCMEG